MDKPISKNQPDSIVMGDVSGQVAIGSHIDQKQAIKSVGSEVSQADLETLHHLIENLREQITITVPAEQQGKAFDRISELEEAITAKNPDLSTMEYVKNWFGKNLPHLAGAVTSLIVNPIVGKLVEVAGEAIANDFKNRFGDN